MESCNVLVKRAGEKWGQLRAGRKRHLQTSQHMPLLKDQPDLSVKMVLDTKSRQKQRAWTRLCGRQVADVPMLEGGF